MTSSGDTMLFDIDNRRGRSSERTGLHARRRPTRERLRFHINDQIGTLTFSCDGFRIVLVLVLYNSTVRIHSVSAHAGSRLMMQVLLQISTLSRF